VNPFERPAVLALVAVVAISFLSAVLWGVFGAELAPARSAEADSFSRSALGHHAFLGLLRELDIPAVVSRYDSAGRAGEDAVLLVVEPALGGAQRQRMLRSMIARSPRVLLVLPKWQGEESGEDPGWVESVSLVPEIQVKDVLSAVDASASLVRLPAGGTVSWESEQVAVRPDLVAPQLLRGAVYPVVRCEHGVLLARLPTDAGEMLILSDPDLLSNHGLARPGNAAAMMAILGLMHREGEAVVIDETLHGFGKEPSLYRALFSFPLVIATIQALLAGAVLLWAAMGRFGAPHPAAPPLEAGKGALIENIATLLGLGGHHAHALRRYLDGAVAEVRAGLHAPARLDANAEEEWLDGNARARGLDGRMGTLRQQVNDLARRRWPDPRATLAVALGVHRWREEMIRGRIGHP
jgi:hypothetical protein